jgi:hypothetical protein
MRDHDYMAGRYGGIPGNSNSPSYHQGLADKHNEQLREHYKKLNEHNDKFKESIRQQQNQSGSYASDGDGVGWLFVLALLGWGIFFIFDTFSDDPDTKQQTSQTSPPATPSSGDVRTRAHALRCS